MKKGRKIIYGANRLPSECNAYDKEKTARFRPLSYYLLGGVDTAGESLSALNNNASVAHSSDEELAEMETNDKVESIGVADPRVDFFDIVEKAGSVSKAETVVTPGSETETAE